MSSPLYVDAALGIFSSWSHVKSTVHEYSPMHVCRVHSIFFTYVQHGTGLAAGPAPDVRIIATLESHQNGSWLSYFWGHMWMVLSFNVLYKSWGSQLALSS